MHPIAGEQVENEFGFVGPNEKYMRHLVGTVRASLGNDVVIYTTDPPPNIAKGSIAGDEVYRYLGNVFCKLPPGAAACHSQGSMVPRTWIVMSIYQLCM